MTETIPPRPARTPRHRARIGLGLAGVLLLEAAVGGLAATTAHAAPRPDGKPTPKQDASSASLEARMTGQRVEVLGERTETQTVWANPDGTLTEDQAAGPIRFRGPDGAWTDVDIELKKSADGGVESKAHPLGLTLAGQRAERPDADATKRLRSAEPVAAANPLVSLTSDRGRRIELGWRGALPAPRIDGTKATYPKALPHADLVVDATRTGFEQFLLLKSREAVDEAGTLRMTLNATGLTARKGKDGGVEFLDSKGAPVGTLPAPMMWDARVDERSGEQLHRAPVALEFAQYGDQVELTLTPDAAFLADPATKFPVTVDPSVNLLTTFTTFVQQGYTTDQSTSKELKIGNNGSNQVARSFLKFNNRPVKNKVVQSATLKLWNHHSWSCQARSWEVWDTASPSTATRWTAQPKWNNKWATSTQTKGFSSACNDGWVTADVKSLMQAWSNNPNAENSLGIRATDEKDAYGWKRFNSRNAASNVPVLSVTYNTLPDTPQGAAGIAPSSYNEFNKQTYVTSPTPTFSAKVSDPDSGTVKAQFEVTAVSAAANGYAWTATSAGVASGQVAKVTVPADKKLGDYWYKVRVRAHDGTAYGPWNTHFSFRVNTGKPAAPKISCDGYPQEQWTDRPGGDITCTLTTASSDGRGYLYGLDDPNTPQKVNDPDGTGGKPQTVKVKAGKGWHTLHARTVDSAGLLSGTTAYQFGVGPKPSVLTVPDVPTTLQEGAEASDTPLLSGVLTSRGQERLRGEFALFDAQGKELPGVALPPAFEYSGNRVASVIPEDTIAPNRPYLWAMRACNDEACSPWTQRRAFSAKTPKDDPAPSTRTVEISGAALADATAPTGAGDCGGKPCAVVQDGTLKVGTPGGTAWRTWFKPDVSAVPPGALITDARLQLHRADCTGSSCVEPAASLRELNRPWNPATQSGQELAAAAAEDLYHAEDEVPVGLPDLNIGDLIADWRYEHTDDNHGLSLQLGDEKTANPGVVYHSSRAADTAKRPKLVVTYVPSGAPSAAGHVKAVPADGGLLATWNAPEEPGAETEAFRYEVVLRKGGSEVARRTTEDTRTTFQGLDNAADHTVTVTVLSPYGKSPAASSAAVRPTPVSDADRYTAAVRDYHAARDGLRSGIHTTLEQALAGSPHSAVFRDLLSAQTENLTERHKTFAKNGMKITAKTELTDLLVGPGPGGSILVRGEVTEKSALRHTDGTEETEEDSLPGRFVFIDGKMQRKANDAEVEVTLPATPEAAQSATVALSGEETFEELFPEDGEAPLVDVGENGLPVDTPGAAAAPMPFAAPDGNGTSNWAKRNVATLSRPYDQGCANFVSHALNRGGKVQQRKGGRTNPSRWFQNKIGPKRFDSYTWAGANNLRNHLKAHRGGREISRYNVRPGDVIFAFYRSDRTWNHAGVVTGGSAGRMNIVQHVGKNQRLNQSTLNGWFQRNKDLRSRLPIDHEHDVIEKGDGGG
ncbi:DNRLRE domain-containing protein [Streptomyces sp. NPDC087440]|uniref:DNRLRE domain-containing protein n=1 Tax=Streptomyces sp. NPDC087440 TaxID=3365790 RepID=UPI00381C4919